MMTRSTAVCLFLALCACDPRPTIVGGRLDEASERLVERWRDSPGAGVFFLDVVQRPDGTLAVLQFQAGEGRAELQLMSAEGSSLSTATLPRRYSAIAADGDDLLLAGEPLPGEQTTTQVVLDRVTTEGTVIAEFAPILEDGETGQTRGLTRGPSDIAFWYSVWADDGTGEYVGRDLLVRLSSRLEPTGAAISFAGIRDADHDADGSLWVLEASFDVSPRVHNVDTGATVVDTDCVALVLDAPGGPACLQIEPVPRLHRLDGSSAPVPLDLELSSGYIAAGKTSGLVGTVGANDMSRLFRVSGAATVTEPFEFQTSRSAASSYPWHITELDDEAAAMIVMEELPDETCAGSYECIRSHLLVVEAE